MGAGGGDQPFALELPADVVEALADLAEDRVRGDAEVLEGELAGVGGVHAHLLEVGCGVVVVEQYVDQVLAVADFGIVLGHGGVEMSGTASDLLASRQALVSAYLG